MKLECRPRVKRMVTSAASAWIVALIESLRREPAWGFMEGRRGSAIPARWGP